MNIFTNKDQQQLLTIKGTHRKTRDQLSREIGVSLPTMTKLINNDAPLAVQNEVYRRFKNWLNETQDK